jgi:hypothetical protein
MTLDNEYFAYHDPLASMRNSLPCPDEHGLPQLLVMIFCSLGSSSQLHQQIDLVTTPILAEFYHAFMVPNSVCVLVCGSPRQIWVKLMTRATLLQ